MKKIEGTVLVSDKNRGMLTALVLLLQKYFNRVITEDNGEKIIELAAMGEVDVVVMDAGGGDGKTFENALALTQKINSLEQNVQVVALINFGQAEAGMRLADEGVFDFAVKPWNNEKLLVTLRNACRTRQLLNAVMEKATQEKMSGRKDVGEEGSDAGKPATLDQMEKKMMKAAIKRNRGNITNAAEELGITRQTLYNKGKKYKLFE
jgi:DNA-binding NtrC family response regulator